MEIFEFAETIVNMPAEAQNEFFKKLKTELNEEEWTATVKFVGLFCMFKSPAKYEAIKTAVCETLCEDIFGHTVERERKLEDPCNPVYMTSIL